VPAENRIRRKAGANLPKDLPAEDLAFDRQASALVVVEPDPFLAVSFLQDLVLGAQVLDGLLLLPVDQAGEDGEEEVPGLQDEYHGWPDAWWRKGRASDRRLGDQIVNAGISLGCGALLRYGH